MAISNSISVYCFGLLRSITGIGVPSGPMPGSTNSSANRNLLIAGMAAGLFVSGGQRQGNVGREFFDQFFDLLGVEAAKNLASGQLRAVLAG